MKMLLFVLSLWSGASLLQADSIEKKMRTMVKEVQAAVQDEKNPDLDAIARIIQKYCNMDTICTTVAKPYLLQKIQGMDGAAKKAYIKGFLPSFKPIYTAYLSRVWASKTNAKTFKEYELKKCTVKNRDAMLTFVKKSNQEKSYISLVLDDNDLVTSIKFGSSKDNMMDPIAADRDNCQAGVSNNKTPSETFA